MCVVYAIGRSFDNLSECYIGVALDPAVRWKQHYTGGRLSELLKENNWSYETNMKIIFEGTVEECFAKELELRPFPNMGLNIASGGHGGYTSYTKDRNKKISNALNGRSMTWGNKVSETKKQQGTHAGSKNVKAKIWILLDPNGKEYRLHGNLFTFCEEHNLSHNALRNNIGNKVGEISPKFRDYGNPKIRERRLNTMGWTLLKEN